MFLENTFGDCEESNNGNDIFIFNYDDADTKEYVF